MANQFADELLAGGHSFTLIDPKLFGCSGSLAGFGLSEHTPALGQKFLAEM